jgi:Ca2+-binding EF-hand superfamily protein
MPLLFARPLALCFALVLCFAHAQPEGALSKEDGAHHHQMADRDHDGKVTHDELVNHIMHLHSLQPETEKEGARADFSSDWFDRADTDGSKSLTQEEFVNSQLTAIEHTQEAAKSHVAGKVKLHAIAEFHEADEDKDGKLNLNEYTRFANRHKNDTRELMKKIDTNKDGEIQKDELMGMDMKKVPPGIARDLLSYRRSEL